MNKLLLTIGILFTCTGFAQNLVPNPSFEQFISCPTLFRTAFNQLSEWERGNTGTSDYYHECGTIHRTGIPYNAQGFQYAHSGQAYTGIYFYYSLSSFTYYREYLQVQLTESLKAGETYFFEMYVSSGDSCRYSTSDIHVHLSSSELKTNSDSVIQLTPLIENQGGIIDDTVNWVRISKLIVASGGEEYLTIGNFKSNVNSTLSISNPTGTVINGAYYYIDDVLLQSCDWKLGSDTTLCNGQQLSIHVPMSNSSFLWQDGSTDSTYIINSAGTYWVEVSDPCGRVLRDSIIVDYYPDNTQPFLGNDTTVCEGEVVNLTIGHINGSYLWSDNSTASTFTVNQAGIYWAQISDNCGSWRDSIQISYNPIPQFDLGPAVDICLGDSVLLDATPQTPGAVTYLWQDGSSNSFLFAKDSGNYWVEVNQFDCIATDTTNITTTICELELEIPNVFSPNGDGINDVFKVSNTSGEIKEMQTQIFNRWGQEVYQTIDPQINWEAADEAAGNYYYLIRATNRKGERLELEGNVMLLR